MLDTGAIDTLAAAEKVGMGVSLTLVGEQVFRAKHGCYCANRAGKASLIHEASKKGGAPQVVVADKMLPQDLRTRAWPDRIFCLPPGHSET